MTKTEMLEKIKATCAEQADIVEFCDHMIAECIGDAAKLKERAELMDKVERALSDGAAMTNKELADIAGVTWQKMSHVTRAMVAAGKIARTDLVDGNGKKTATAFHVA